MKNFFLAILNPEFILLQIYHNLIGLESNKHVPYLGQPSFNTGDYTSRSKFPAAPSGTNFLWVPEQLGQLIGQTDVSLLEINIKSKPRPENSY